MFGSEDGERILQLSNSSLTANLRLSDLNSGRTMPWKFNPMEHQPTLE
jgi:hypothetical protein